MGRRKREGEKKSSRRDRHTPASKFTAELRNERRERLRSTLNTPHRWKSSSTRARRAGVNPNQRPRLSENSRPSILPRLQPAKSPSTEEATATAVAARQRFSDRTEENIGRVRSPATWS